MPPSFLLFLSIDGERGGRVVVAFLIGLVLGVLIGLVARRL